MSQRVVDLLEAVEVEKRDGQSSIVTTCFADALTQQFVEHTSVWQSRESIVICQVFNALRVRELALAFANPALSELPAHAAQERSQHDYQNASEHCPPQKCERFAMRDSQLLIGR